MIDLIDATNWTRLERLDLTNTQITRIPRYLATLKHLILSENPHLTLRADEDKPTPLPLLETFACSSTSIDGETLKLIVGDSIKAGNLKRLTIGDRLVNERPNLVKNEFPPSEIVEDLSLVAMNLNDRSALEVVNLYPNLKRLDISSTKITGVAVKAFVKMGIKWLKINDCGMIGIDAVEWARGKDIEVVHNFAGHGVRMKVPTRFADSVFANRF